MWRRGLRLRLRLTVEDAAGADKMFVIIPIVHVADHHAGDGRMHKFIVPQVDTYVGDGIMFAQGMKKDQIAFLQFIPTDMVRGLILLF